MPGKICVICGQDCSDRPRVKDPEGRYACRACAERNAAQAKPVAPAKPPAAPRPIEPVPVEAPLGLEPVGLKADHFDGLDLSNLSASDANPCPGCGMPRAAGAVVCMSCGYNAQTGGKIRTSVKKAKEPKPGKDGEPRIVSYGWVGILVMVGAFIALPLVATTSEGALGLSLLAAAIWAIVAWIMMIVAAFRDGDGKWGIIGLCNLIPCIGGLFGLAFAFYYCIVGSERTGWKLNYWCSVGAMIAIYVVMFVQYPELIEEYTQSP